MTEEEIRIRRFYIPDEVWERSHNTWKKLKPRRNFNYREPSDETPLEYSQRIISIFNNIPTHVLIQWQFEHIYDFDMVNNYGWINYHQVTFNVVDWSEKEFFKVQIFSGFKDYVNRRSYISNFDHLSCTDEDKDYWMQFGTWRVPIIVLETENIINVPNYAELNRPYQLVEGHTRFGNYNAIKYLSEQGKVQISNKHKVFLMSVS
ncbi:hypothetical protein [Nostoc sp. FACHB-888]|uniref:hypothetical protein n=1 Tax=Nostoc sp. FACHB-888 TaxID=2692842 RepID=UPI00168910E4|nr:hypothetical protein [Nostoc sp. FACHB-888]MBD2244150.1 hypothetical protein [Nostoc sp. FACHB-888]